MTGRNDGNSGSAETRKQPALADSDRTEADSRTAASSQADGKAETENQTEEDIEVERQASGE